jgi:endonuclease G, mitochondrial
MRISLIPVSTLIIALCSALQSSSPNVPTRDDNLALGNPSDAEAGQDHKNNYLIRHHQFVLSYNAAKGIPNWVSWHLSTAWKGDYKRTNPFRPDEQIPRKSYSVTKKDYSGTGFDRGHMCPSDDRDLNRTDNDATFLMSNMVPQSHHCNAGPWGEFEEYCRMLAAQGNEMYIVAGPLGRGGVGINGPASTIAHGRIEVPAFVWKVAVILPNGTNDRFRIDDCTRTIAVVMPNREDSKGKWHDFRVSIDEVECLTGYDFFSLLDDCIESQIELYPDTVRFKGHHL